jgi:RNA polymerase sigma-70 factor (ECF subfamily)
MQWPGNPRRVQQLVDAHYQPLFRYAFRLSGSPADAEDLTQEAFCKAQLRLHQLRDPTRAKPWLFSILRNAYLHRLRAGAHHREVPLDAIGDLAGPAPEPPPDVEPAQLQAALNDLPEAFRTPVILFYFEDFSYRDIAEQLDLPIGTVMSRLARAKAHLRARLQSRHPSPGFGGEQTGVNALGCFETTAPSPPSLLPKSRERGEKKGAIHGL